MVAIAKFLRQAYDLLLLRYYNEGSFDVASPAPMVRQAHHPEQSRGIERLRGYLSKFYLYM
jgi:hypothetical protein